MFISAMKIRSGMIVLAIMAIVVFDACSTADPLPHDSVISIAVWDVVDLSPARYQRVDMGELLAGKITQRLSETNRFQVVERQDLIKAMQELQVGSSDLASEATRLKLGQIIGAQQMVFGAFQVIGSQVRLDLRRVDVSSGKILNTATTTTASNDIAAWMDAAQQLASELVE